MHPLLAFQLRRLGLVPGTRPSQGGWWSFLETVEQTYGRNIKGGQGVELAGAELASTIASLDPIVDNIPDVVVVRDATTLRFVRVNRAGELLLGLSRAEVIGKTRDELPANVRAVVAELPTLASVEGRAPIAMPVRAVEIHGSLHWMQTKVVFIPAGGESPALLLEISADVSERHRASVELERRVEERTSALLATEEQLRQAQKLDAIGRLAGGVAHDFNNMLAVILSCTEMALQQPAAQAELREDLREVHAAARRASALTQQLLAFSRQHVLEPRRIDLNRIVREMSGMVSRLIGEKIHCCFSPCDGELFIEADPSQVQQVILNLVVNARDAMSGGGTLAVETGVGAAPAHVQATAIGNAERYASLVVRDTGVGMNERTLSRLFEPFFTTKDRGKGTGLGLATVYGIVRQSGGDVTVESVEGTGSTFRVYFPVSEDAPIRRTTPLPPLSRGGKETVLVVEDDDAVRRTASRVLTKAGYRVLDACGAEQALDLIDGERIDVVVTDVVMPGLSGEELAEDLARRGVRARVVLMSGYLDGTVSFCPRRNPDRTFVQKPFSHATLLAAVRGALDADMI